MNLAARSLQTQMTGVEVSGQNLANVNTTGYTRQTVDITASPDIAADGLSEGTGANVASIQQAVNTLLNTQIQGQQSTGGYWNAQQSALQSAQTSLNEFLNGTASTASSTGSAGTTDTGLSSQLSGFFNAFQALSAAPTSTSARQAVISAAQTLSTSFQQINSQLNATRTTLNTSLGNDVTSANQLVSAIATLNKQISAATFSGGAPNDLIDTREQDLENLSNLANISTSTEANGSVDVSVGGQALVSGSQVLDTLQTFDPGNGNRLVQTVNGGATLTLTGGTMQGTIDARDGTLATLQTGINALASTLITNVNNVNDNGYNLTGTGGNAFFDGSDASSITVNPTVVNNPSMIQASGSVTATGDNTVALAIANLADLAQPTLNGQTYGGAYTQSVAALGDALQTANTQVANQTSVGNMLATQRSSVSGVNVDEEMTNLMTFQKAYEASADLVNTVNQMMQSVLQMVT
jgi:flagellar hook-associated protein 1 FlgK